MSHPNPTSLTTSDMIYVRRYDSNKGYIDFYARGLDVISLVADYIPATEIPFIATENITAFKVVTSTGNIADSSISSQRNKAIGIAKDAVLNGFSGSAVGFGLIINSAWSWTTGDKIYLNGTSLSTTATSTGYSQFIGTATAPDRIDVKLGPPILL